MKRIELTPRANWIEKVQTAGCAYPVYEGADGEEHQDWFEGAAYELTTAEVEQLKKATADVTASIMAAAESAMSNAHVLSTMGIPEQTHPLVRRSWEQKHRNLVMRLDWTFVDGVPKLIEVNASPTHGLVLGGPAQLGWLAEVAPNKNQWNDIEMSLRRGLKDLGVNRLGFAAMAEDQAMKNEAQFLHRTAVKAGLDATYLDLEQVGYNRLENVYTDVDNSVFDGVYAMVPMEALLDTEFAEPWFEKVPPKGTFFEPVWVLLLQSKAFLAWLWNQETTNEYLLPTYLESDHDSKLLGNTFVRKPFWGADGANVQIIEDGRVTAHQIDDAAEDPGEGEWVVQQYAPLPCMDGKHHAAFSTWVIGRLPAGLTVCEGPRITDYYSPILPHYVA